jgi:chitin biosynthesis protein CHS5
MFLFFYHISRSNKENYRMVAISSYYLGATPASPTTFTRPHSMSQASLTRPGTNSTPPPNRTRSPHRASMPAPHRTAGTPPSNVSPFLNQNQLTSPDRSAPFAPTPEESPENEAEEVQLERSTNDRRTKIRRNTDSGEMNPQFRFPASAPASSGVSMRRERKSPPEDLDDKINVPAQSSSVVTPSSIEVPPPPPVEKERSTSSIPVDEGEEEDDVGDTVDIPLN